MQRIPKFVGGFTLLAVGLVVGWVFSTIGAGQEVPIASLTELEREFVEEMRNVVLVGHFTVEGLEGRDGLPERYEISRVTKLEGNRWRFNARVTYASVDVTLPIVVPIVWAGDTPMVTITDFSIPGLGDEFGARVVFYDDRYAGTWDHGEYGGLMYGSIEPLDSD